MNDFPFNNLHCKGDEEGDEGDGDELVTDEFL